MPIRPEPDKELLKTQDEAHRRAHLERCKKIAIEIKR
jgi:hypothetical protein